MSRIRRARDLSGGTREPLRDGCRTRDGGADNDRVKEDLKMRSWVKRKKCQWTEASGQVTFAATSELNGL